MKQNKKSVRAILATRETNPNGKPIVTIEETDKLTSITEVAPVAETELEKVIKRLEEENNQLKNQIKSIPTTLEERLNFVNEKMALAKKLQSFELMASRIDENIEEIENSIEENPFENPNHLIVFQTGNRYQKEDFLTIQNPIVLTKTYEFVKSILAEEIVKIETLINS